MNKKLVALLPMRRFLGYFCSVCLMLTSCGNADQRTAKTSINSLGSIKSGAVKNNATSDSSRIQIIPKEHAVKITDDESFLQKATVSKVDSTIWLAANMRLDHRIFGYEQPDTNSRKMILISIFTSDVEGNPYQCPFGSYYETAGMNPMKLKYLSKKGRFVKANLLKKDTIQVAVYFDHKWIEFDE